MNLKVHNVTKKYKGFEAVKNANIAFTTGIWGLLGPNGAGKTTLMRMLVGNLKPSAGDISLNKNSITSLGEDYLDKIGYLPQLFGYDKGQTVEDFLHYIGCLKGIDKNTRKYRINELLEQFDLKCVRSKKIDKLSGGMKRRVGICQAMINEPDILIVDEPTAGLDIEERRNFRKYLTDISRDKIIILSTHIVSDIEFIANYLILMQAGEVIENGESDSLIKSIDGLVYETLVDTDGLKYIENNYCLVNLHNEENSMIRVRYIGKYPYENSKVVKPSLNDFYLSRMKGVK